MNKLPWNIFKYQLYILQAEEYDLDRYLQTLSNRGLFNNTSLRKQPVFTKKFIVLFLLGHIFLAFDSILLAAAITYFFKLSLAVFVIAAIVFAFTLSYLSFVYIYLAALLLKPFENIAKNRIVSRAKKKVQSLDKLKIVGVTGSYGKTSMKDTVATILSEKYKVVKTEGNNNTPIGISRTILNKVDSSTEVFVVEMGEYVKGDVKSLCEIAPPDFSIITGINEAHLERYGSMDDAISTKFEIIEYSKPNATSLLNADDELILENFEKYTKNKNVKFFGFNNKSEVKISTVEIKDDLSGSQAKLQYDDSEIELAITPIADYYYVYLAAALIVATDLGMNLNEFRFAARKIEPAEHRLEVKKLSNGGTVIDDSYNGNSDGVKYGIQLLSRISGFKTKIYATPGLAETGYLKQELHEEIAEFLFKASFDKIYLIKNSASEIIKSKLKDLGYDMKKVRMFENSNESWKQIYSSLESGDLLMIQNDLADIYV